MCSCYMFIIGKGPDSCRKSTTELNTAYDKLYLLLLFQLQNADTVASCKCAKSIDNKLEKLVKTMNGAEAM